MKGSYEMVEYFSLIEILIVVSALVIIFATHFLIPGMDASKLIQSVSQGNLLATTINAMSVQEEGEVKISFTDVLRVVVGIENKRNFISVGDEKKKIFFEARVKNLLSKKAKQLVIKKDKSSSLVEVIAE